MELLVFVSVVQQSNINTPKALTPPLPLGEGWGEGPGEGHNPHKIIASHLRLH